MAHLHIIDWMILLIFFLALAALVIWISRLKEESSSDYFLAGRSAKWWQIGSSIFSSNIGSEHLVGLAGAGAATGMAMAHWEMQGWMILILGWVFVPFYDRAKIFTMPEFIERRYSSGSRVFLSFISLISYVLTKISVTIYVGGIVFKSVLGIDSLFGIDFFWIGALILVVITAIITVAGGMKAVLFTAVIQTPILIIGSLIIVGIGLHKLGGWGELERLVGHNIHLIRPVSDPHFPWPGVIMASAIIGFWYWCTDQYIVQRTLAAQDQKQARRGAIFAGYLKLLPVLLFLIPGMIAFALNQKGLVHFEKADESYLTLVSNILPVGIKGIVIVGMFSALICSLASKFNSTATLFTIDFYKKFWPDTSELKLVKVGRIATVVIVILGFSWIVIIKLLSDVLYSYIQNVQALIAPSIAAIFLLGVFSKRTTAKAAFYGLVTGFILGMFRLSLDIFKKFLPKDGFLNAIASINTLYFSGILLALCFVIIIVISYFTTKPDDAKLSGLTWYSATPKQISETRSSWNKWDVIHF